MANYEYDHSRGFFSNIKTAFMQGVNEKRDEINAKNEKDKLDPENATGINGFFNKLEKKLDDFVERKETEAREQAIQEMKNAGEIIDEPVIQVAENSPVVEPVPDVKMDVYTPRYSASLCSNLSAMAVMYSNELYRVTLKTGVDSCVMSATDMREHNDDWKKHWSKELIGYTENGYVNVDEFISAASPAKIHSIVTGLACMNEDNMQLRQDIAKIDAKLYKAENIIIEKNAKIEALQKEISQLKGSM